jgi:hypothetical protein
MILSARLLGLFKPNTGIIEQLYIEKNEPLSFGKYEPLSFGKYELLPFGKNDSFNTNNKTKESVFSDFNDWFHQHFTNF